MNKNIVIALVLVIAVFGAIMVTQQAQKASEQKAMQEKAAMEANRLAEEAKKALQEADMARKKAMEEAKKAEEAARKEAEALQAKIGSLIAQAKSMLAGGKFQEAIDTAKNILSLDANNQEAKSILETAMAKLQDFAQQKAGTLQDEGKKTLESLTNTLKQPAAAQ